jgi:transcriptional regulator with XRE-family HTH domain
VAPRKNALKSFARHIRSCRRSLGLTQEEVARRIATTTPYISHLESGKRHPSEKVVVKLADALGIDRAQLFLLANPAAEAILTPPDESEHGSAWEEFRKDKRLHRIHKISVEEMVLLSQIDMLGAGVRSARDYMFILNTIRHALGR